MSIQNNATLQMIRNILNGTTIPARATNATNDGEGNNIPDTYAKKGGKIIPVGVFPPSSAGTTLVLGTYDGEVSVGDVALIMALVGASSWGSYQIGDLYEITAVNSNAVTLASSAIGNIFGTSGRYRVGDWVLSDNNASPASEYGGSWEQVENVFLYASGTNDVGATGGTESHNHTLSDAGFAKIALVQDRLTTANKSVSNWQATITTQDGLINAYNVTWNNLNEGATLGGESDDASVMPPYRVTNFWRRVA